MPNQSPAALMASSQLSILIHVASEGKKQEVLKAFGVAVLDWPATHPPESLHTPEQPGLPRRHLATFANAAPICSDHF